MEQTALARSTGPGQRDDTAGRNMQVKPRQDRCTVCITNLDVAEVHGWGRRAHDKAGTLGSCVAGASRQSRYGGLGSLTVVIGGRQTANGGVDFRGQRQDEEGPG